jgi:hypothetical protein
MRTLALLPSVFAGLACAATAAAQVSGVFVCRNPSVMAVLDLHQKGPGLAATYEILYADDRSAAGYTINTVQLLGSVHDKTIELRGKGNWWMGKASHCAGEVQGGMIVLSLLGSKGSAQKFDFAKSTAKAWNAALSDYKLKRYAQVQGQDLAAAINGRVEWMRQRVAEDERASRQAKGDMVDANDTLRADDRKMAEEKKALGTAGQSTVAGAVTSRINDITTGMREAKAVLDRAKASLQAAESERADLTREASVWSAGHYPEFRDRMQAGTIWFVWTTKATPVYREPWKESVQVDTAVAREWRTVLPLRGGWYLLLTRQNGLGWIRGEMVSPVKAERF